jgi:predicted DsbA family dithiol-disulfide isomerase
MRMLEQEFGDSLEVVWKSFLLRPRPDPGRTLEQFREYTKSWVRVGQQPDSGVFRVWDTGEGPPSHSVPPHLAATAAASFGREAFERLHARLLSAYFTENRDITSPGTLAALWEEVGLPAGGLARAGASEVLAQVMEDHKEAVACGADGVPAFRSEGTNTVITGAHPLDLFRRWVRRLLQGGG